MNMLTTINIGTLVIGTYNLMIGLGAFGMLLCTLKRKIRFQINSFQCIVFSLLLTLCGIAGAKLLYFLESGLQSTGGVSFFGSVYLIPFVMPVIGLLFHLSFSKTLDLCAPCVAVMIGFIRIGCLLCGCCGGWVVYVGDYYFAWPTQIMESIGDFLILFMLLHTEAKGSWTGLLYPLFMFSYSVMRFFLEFLRYTPDKWFGLGHGQWFAIMAILVSLLWIAIQKKKSKTA